MAAMQVALVPPGVEMQAADPARPGFVMARVDNICEEDEEEERAQWYAALHNAGYRSKRRLRNMTDYNELVGVGIPLVIAKMMVQQAIRMHGAVPQAAGVGGQQLQETSTPWNAADLQDFPKPVQGGSTVMGLAPKEQMLSHLRRVVYYATMRSEDIGDRCSDVLNRRGLMSEEDFAALDAGALKADQQGLAAVITGSMPDATLQWLESQVDWRGGYRPSHGVYLGETLS